MAELRERHLGIPSANGREAGAGEVCAGFSVTLEARSYRLMRWMIRFRRDVKAAVRLPTPSRTLANSGSLTKSRFVKSPKRAS